MQRFASVALYHGEGQPFEICEREITLPHPDDVLVQVSLATICGSDLHTVTGQRMAPTPCVLGHEAVGRISSPTNVRDACGQPLREGDRVTWSIMAACGACYYCDERNLPQKCERLFKYGHARSEDSYFLNGSFAEYICLRSGTAIYRIPDAVSDAEAIPLNCALATVLGGLDLVHVPEGGCAIVQGAGMLGIYAVCCLRERGCEIIAAVDCLVERLRMAEAFGATHTFNLSEESVDEIGEALDDLTGGRGADLTVEVSGAGGALVNSIDWLGVGGQCLTLGFVFQHSDVTVDAHKIVTKCLTVRGNHNYHPSVLGDALRFVEETRDRYPFEALIGAIYPLEGINAAFDRAMQGDVIRIAIDPGKLTTPVTKNEEGQ
jgi:alcohol dehydrogenase